MKIVKQEGILKLIFGRQMLIACCLLLLCQTLSYSQQFPYKFKYLTVDEGLSHTDANDIAQDRQGYIWVATLFGINRYDGYALKKYYNSNAPLKNAFKNRIRSICPDETGNIWLGTENGLQRFNATTEKYTDFDELQNMHLIFDKLIKPAGGILYGIANGQFKRFLVNGDKLEEQKLKVPANVVFSDITIDQNGSLYLSSNKGLWSFSKSQIFTYINIEGVNYPDLAAVFIDKKQNLLTASCNKVFLFSKSTISKNQNSSKLKADKEFTSSLTPCIKGIVEGNNADFWLNAGTDLMRLDVKSSVIEVLDNKHSLRNLNSFSIAKIFVDRSECLWVGTYGGGVNFCDLNEKLFYTLQHDPEISNTLSGNHIRSVIEHGDSLWLGTTANGLNLYNLKTQKFEYFNTYNSSVRLKSDKITALTFDDDENLWIGSALGIEILKRGLRALWKPVGYENFPKYPIGTLVKDCFGNIWFGNLRKNFGVIWQDKQQNYHVRYFGEGHFIYANKYNPLVLVSSTQGVQQLTIDEEGNVKKMIRYSTFSSANKLSSDYACPVASQNDSTYWIGTIGGAINRLTLKAGKSFGIIQSFTGSGIFNDVESLEIDNVGNIWMGGNGLECLNPSTGSLVKYDKNDGLQGNSFKVGISYKGTDGKLYFGGINGLNYFHPQQIKSNHIEARPVLTDILINNHKPAYTESSKELLPAAIGYSDHITLNHLQNNFVISFSSMHFANTLKCRYRYKLIGFDKDWKFTDGKNPSAAYSNLDYSSYTFVVEATNNDGVWSKKHAEMNIVISPPWWKSRFAKVTYALLAISALLGIYIYQARWYRLKRELEVRAVNEKKKEEIHKQREELYQQQLTFFTNVSHDFRTPLSLILGPLEQLMSQNKNALLNSSYQLMYRNTKRLINLINELMNVRKVADGAIKLHVQPLEVNQFCREVAAEFETLANSKHITFKLIDHTEKNDNAATKSLVDINVLEKILLNLLNNAFKYTDNGGDILLEVFFDIENRKALYATSFQLLNESARANRYLYFCVADSGIGISPDSISKIFDRYYRVSNDHLGSGVGLALVKSLTHLHKGDIYVFSERHKGTEIIIGLPWGEENYDQSEIAIVPDDVNKELELVDNDVLLPLPDDQADKHPAFSKIQKNILLVDDNHELRLFIKQALKKNYYVHEAHDGHSAIEIAKETIPDLIISDVMMPGMNGIEFCKVMKESFETSHVPFIILSAKDALPSQIEGLESGADYYFAKPLSIDLLLLTIQNIFEQDKRLKHRYTSNYLSDATELVQSEKDKDFFNKLLKIIDDNIENADLDVDFLCGHLYISRTKLYQKIKSITNQSVAEFIRTIRLKRAIHIMTHEDVTTNEVADRTGLQSGSNFSRVFKKEYGKSPSQFIQALKKSV